MNVFFRNALNQTLNYLQETPTITMTPANSEGWQKAKLTWSDTKYFEFELLFNPQEGQTLACILAREGLTYAWGEKFMTAFYNAVDGRPPDMPRLDEIVDEYADMPPLEGHS